MRILYLSQLMPYPADAGAKVRQYYTLRYLSQQHEVTLLAFTRPDDQPHARAHMESFCKAVLTVPMVRTKWRDAAVLAESWLSGKSFIIRRDRVPQMVDLVQQELLSGGYDAVHADQLWMAQYALLAADLAVAGKITRPWLVLDEHNACYQIFQRLAQGTSSPLKRLALEREWRLLQRYERKACAQFDHVVTVTEEDREILESMVGEEVRESGDHKPQFSTIPICEDTAAEPPVTPLNGTPEVLHLGTMFWPPNIEGVQWFIEQVWPLVRSQLPESRFTVVGKSPPDGLKALAVDGSGIHFTDYVEDPLPYLEHAGAFVVPLFSAGGMRVKIVDGWRWGLPVISTTIGAEGIHYREGENILIADDPDRFADDVIRVLQDKQLAGRLRHNGRRWVEQRYDWRGVYPAWDTVYAS